MIRDHVWRPVGRTSDAIRETPVWRRPCGYMNCRQPIERHERAISAAGAR